MVIAVVTMWVVQVPVDEIIDMITMGHSLVPTVGAVNMIGLMTTTHVARGALIRVGCTDLNCVLVDMVTVRVMQMPVMEIIDVVPVLYRRMPAAGAVDVIVV